MQGFELDSLDFLASIFIEDNLISLVRNTASALLPAVRSSKYTASAWRIAFTAFPTFSADPNYDFEHANRKNSSALNLLLPWNNLLPHCKPYLFQWASFQPL